MTAIVAGEILWKYSVAAAAGNTTAGTAAGSLGDQISTTVLLTAGGNEWFDDISGAENAASTVDYRGFFVHNSNGANPYVNAVLYISAETAGGASIAIWPDSTAISALGSASPQMLTIANETTAPAGASFSSPTTAGTGLSLSTSLTNGFVKGFWIRRTAANTAALSNDGATLATSGDTGSL